MFQKSQFAEKVVLITGSSRGIGKDIAIYFASQKARLVINFSKSKKEAEKTFNIVKKYNPDSLLIQADVTQKNQVDDMINVIIKKYKHIDILINNAGAVFEPAKWNQVTTESWNNTINVNLTGTFNCIQSIAPFMIKRKRGNIINISSTASVNPSTDAIAYSVAKSGINALTYAFAKELAPYIKVNSVSPGWTNTDWHKNKNSEFIDMVKNIVPFKRLAKINEITSTVAFLASENSSFITGQNIIIDGGLTIK